MVEAVHWDLKQLINMVLGFAWSHEVAYLICSEPIDACPVLLNEFNMFQVTFLIH